MLQENTSSHRNGLPLTIALWLGAAFVGTAVAAGQDGYGGGGAMRRAADGKTIEIVSWDSPMLKALDDEWRKECAAIDREMDGKTAWQERGLGEASGSPITARVSRPRFREFPTTGTEKG